MGLVGVLKTFARVTRKAAEVSDVQLDPGGGPNLTGQHFSAPGDDAHPLPDDYVTAVSVTQTGRVAVVGYVDPNNEQKAELGEKRIYARNSSGSTVVELWLKNSSEAELFNANGSVTLRPDGTIEADNSNGTLVLNANGSIVGQNSNGSFELESGGDFVINGVRIDVNGNVTVPSSLQINGVEVFGHYHEQDSDSDGDSEEDTGPMTNV